MSNTYKKTPIIIASITIITLVAAGSVILLGNLLHTAEQQKAKLSAQETITLTRIALNQNPQTKDYEFLQNAEDQLQPMIVVDPKSNTALFVNSKSYITIQKMAAVSSDDAAKINEIVKKIFTDNDFIQSKPIKTDSTISLRYTNKIAQCQFSHFVDTLNTNNSFQLVCANEVDHANELLLTSQLLDLWKKPVAYDYLVQESITEGNYTAKRINTINTGDPSKSHTLIYVKNNGAWLYIADAAEGDPKLSNGKYILNEDLKKGLANESYGPLLTKLLVSSKK